MIQYKISTGELWRGGTLMGVGYSGQPACKNDPTKCDVHNQGPIPPGIYSIGEPIDTDTHGPFVLVLTPDPGNEMYGRTGFMMHGDSLTHPGTASEGCIIMPRIVRETVHRLEEDRLEVIP